MTVAKKRIEAALVECETHIRRLHHVHDKLAGFFPLNPESFENLEEDIVTYLDQFLFRFMKLQDTMGTKLFPIIASLITGSDDPRPFFDTLNILEKNFLINSAEEWQELRVIRNTIAHDYPDTADQTVSALNHLMTGWQNLEKMFLSLKEYNQSKLSAQF